MAETETESQGPTWEQAHQALVGLARKMAGLELEEGRWLLMAERARVDRRLGYGSFVEYVERLFGYAPRLTHEKLRVADALTELPELAAALGNGELSWSSVRELTRVATAKTEQPWLKAAQGRTVREVERLVSGRKRGSLPTDRADPNAQRHVLRFEVSGEVLATFREAMSKLQRDAGGGLDDDSALFLMARQVLGGPVDDGRSSYQVELTLCEDCQLMRQQGRGELVDVGDEVAEMARCDAQRLARPDAGPQTVATHLGDRAKPHRGDRAKTHVGRAKPHRGDRAKTHVDRAKPHVGDQATKTRARAKQDIPPALRRDVVRRDRHRCRVPGCRHAIFLDLHHIRTREDGGEHEADNLITLCGAHHRALHTGELRVDGRESTGLRFSHADGSDYGGVASIAGPVAAAQAKAFQALRELGFGEREARGALSEIQAVRGLETSVEATLRAALEHLTAGTQKRAS